jgi:hypothetical protein
LLDLHGFVAPTVIEPCTPPHNPNYEYDLYLRWAYNQVLAMEAELFAQTDKTETIIPYRDWDLVTKLADEYDLDVFSVQNFPKKR